jgi:hypothetical protein
MESVILKEEILNNASTLGSGSGSGTPGGVKSFGGPAGGGVPAGRKNAEAAEAAERRARINTEV